MPATAIVDVGALLQMVYVALLAGVGICIAYAVAVVAVVKSSEHRRAGRDGSALVLAAVGAAGVAVCGWAIYAGLAIMINGK